MEQKIHSCPDCNNKNVIAVSIKDTYCIYCPKCELLGPDCSDIEGAIERWNWYIEIFSKGAPREGSPFTHIGKHKVTEYKKQLPSSDYSLTRKNKWELNMRSLILPSIFVLMLIVIPTIMISNEQQYYNPLTQILFDILLFGASIWFAFTISNRDAKKTASEKWLPAAEIASIDLLTLSATANRIKLKQSQLCETIVPLFVGIPEEKSTALNIIFNSHCSEIKESLTNFENIVSNCYSTWQIFITANCEKNECTQIQDRLRFKQMKLENAIDLDFKIKS